VDGNDVEAVRAAIGEAVARARRGEGPSLIEARTWRARGHWAGDTEAYRPQQAPPPDPIARYAARLAERGEASAAELAALDVAVAEEVAAAVARAEAEPDAGPAELGLDEVYA
jgi:pyruvate dehydrogenase E1 component alpha subunit